jgi:hypothetical protein
MQAVTESHNLGDNSTQEDLGSNRLLVGARSYERGDAFTAYLNCADEQNPAGVTVAVGGLNVAFINRVESPTGRTVIYTPPGIQARENKFSISLDNTIGPDFYGTYRVFVRAYQNGGSDGDIIFWFGVRGGSGRPITYSSSAEMWAGDDFYPYDMGVYTIDPPSTYAYNAVAFYIDMECTTGAAIPSAHFYDVVLIPADEWIADIYDTSSTREASMIDRRSLDIDSVTFPKNEHLAMLRDVTTGHIRTQYTNVTPSPPVMQSSGRQRLWFLATGFWYATEAGLFAFPGVSKSLTSQIVHRYYSMRGDS